jgi:pyrroloquinoline quinone biosynthesis protein D
MLLRASNWAAQEANRHCDQCRKCCEICYACRTASGVCDPSPPSDAASLIRRDVFIDHHRREGSRYARELPLRRPRGLDLPVLATAGQTFSLWRINERSQSMTARSRTIIEPSSVPRFPRGTRFRFDATRQAWVILAPERLMMPDEIAVEVLKLVDGTRSVGTIAGHLAAQFGAPHAEVLADVLVMLQELADDTVLEDASSTGPQPP